MGTDMLASLLAGVLVLPHEDPLFLPRVTTSAVSAAAAVTVPPGPAQTPTDPPTKGTGCPHPITPLLLTALFLEASEQPC